jgi:hypothetical protein
MKLIVFKFFLGQYKTFWGFSIGVFDYYQTFLLPLKKTITVNNIARAEI